MAKRKKPSTSYRSPKDEAAPEQAQQEQQPSTDTGEPSAYIFIGRLTQPPFVFSALGPMNSSNLLWIRTGIIVEGDYLKQFDMRRSTRPEGKIWDMAEGNRVSIPKFKDESVLVVYDDDEEMIDLTSAD